MVGRLTLVPAATGARRPRRRRPRRAGLPRRRRARWPCCPPVPRPRSRPPARCCAPTSRSRTAPTSSSSPPARPAAAGRCCSPPAPLRASADGHARPARRARGLAARAAGVGDRRAPGAAAAACSAGTPAAVLEPRRDPRRRGRPDARGGRRYTSLVPTQLRRFLDAEPDALRAFDAVLVGGAATDPALLDRARDRGRRRRHHLRHDRDRRRLRVRRPPAGRRRRSGWRTTACGWPARCWRTATACDPAATAAAFADGWFRTRDAGSPRRATAGSPSPAGWTTSSSPAASTSRPLAVEAALRDHPDVADAVVFGRAGRRVGSAGGRRRRRRPRAPRPSWPAPPLGDRAARRPGGAARAAPARRSSRCCTPASPTGARSPTPSAEERADHGHPRPVAGRRPAAHPARRPRARCSWAPAPPPRSTASGRSRRCSRCVVALALQVAVNYANDYSDGRRGTDADRVGPDAPGRLRAPPPPRQVLIAAAPGLRRGRRSPGSPSPRCRSWWLVAVGAVCIAAAWTYTGGPLPYGYRALGEVFVFVFFGLVAVVGTTFVQTRTLRRAGVRRRGADRAAARSRCWWSTTCATSTVTRSSASGRSRCCSATAARGWPTSACWWSPSSSSSSIGVVRPWALLGLLAAPLAVPPVRTVLSGGRGSGADRARCRAPAC